MTITSRWGSSSRKTNGPPNPTKIPASTRVEHRKELRVNDVGFLFPRVFFYNTVPSASLDLRAANKWDVERPTHYSF